MITRFYKMEAATADALRQTTDSGLRKPYQQWEILQGLTERMESYYQKSGAYFLVANIRAGANHSSLTLAGFLADSMDAKQETDRLFRSLSVPLDQLRIEELTVQSATALVDSAYTYDFIDIGTEDVWNLLGFGAFDNISRCFEKCERMAPASGGKAALLAKKELVFCGDTLYPELERIYQGGKGDVTGIPVHYLISTKSPEGRDAVVDALVDSLAQNSRIKSRRVCQMAIDENTHYDQEDAEVFEAYYRAASNCGAIVIDYRKAEEELPNLHKSANNADISFLCRIIRKYWSSVVTILCLTVGESATERAFREETQGLTFVAIREREIDGQSARQYMLAKAEECGIAATQELFVCVEKRRLYSEYDLKKAFDRWYGNRLKTDVYPQYAYLAEERVSFEQSEMKGSAYQELHEMIGLVEAKRTIEKMIAQCKAKRLFFEHGIPFENAAMHMVFTGNPGTAKTSVARLFARIMKENQLLPVGSLIEVGRAGLVGRYVGWTAPLVKRRFEQAKGSVLFIDEAYSLLDGPEGEYGDEAINTIVQEMENHREDVAVIFAGYPDKMEQFLKRNPGLRSRIAFHVEFDDYTAEELYQILELTARKSCVVLDDDVRQTLLPMLHRASLAQNFGNGRFVRNLFEQARMNQAARLLRGDAALVTTQQMTTLLAEDFQGIERWHTELRPSTSIGFAV